MSTSNPVMVLCVDGPTRGRLRAVTSGTRFLVYDNPVVTSIRIPDLYDRDLEALTYHVHIVTLLGFATRIASLQIDQNKIDPYDIIHALFSEAGRQATYRVDASAR
jgi:hypothetical protein